LFFDIICPTISNEFSKRFEDYALISIETESEEFFRNLYGLHHDGKIELDRACRICFDMLLLGMKNEMKKVNAQWHILFLPGYIGISKASLIK